MRKLLAAAQARSLIERQWWYDQVVFAASLKS
jgi:hypothetical protein